MGESGNLVTKKTPVIPVATRLPKCNAVATNNENEF